MSVGTMQTAVADPPVQPRETGNEASPVALEQ
jgi:hypothetical protein